MHLFTTLFLGNRREFDDMKQEYETMFQQMKDDIKSLQTALASLKGNANACNPQSKTYSVVYRTINLKGRIPSILVVHFTSKIKSL